MTSCFNPYCDKPAVGPVTLFGRTIGETCDTCGPQFVPTDRVDLQARLAVTQAIVRALAAADEPIYDSMYCLLCHGNPDDHTPGCLWDRARDWVATHPASPEGTDT